VSDGPQWCYCGGETEIEWGHEYGHGPTLCRPQGHHLHETRIEPDGRSRFCSCGWSGLSLCHTTEMAAGIEARMHVEAAAVQDHLQEPGGAQE
jgi:hypothetical protein